jgi:nitrate/TMAO reductase-like tetraheme cytochrome c subunit
VGSNGNSLDERRPVLWFLTSHWLSILGSALATIAGCSWIFVMALHSNGRVANPYVGILLAFAIPVIFFAGLALIPIGTWMARRNIKAGLSAPQTRRVVLRRLAYFFAAMTLVNVVIASQVTYRAVAHMETDQFCGQSCHVMKPQFVANRRTPHRNVACVDCHIVPGAAGYVKAKMNGQKQLVEVVLNNYERPVPPALASDKLAPSSETCETCHSRSTEIGQSLIIRSKFKDDEMNTPTQSVLMMNVGGGRLGGIHGIHMSPDIEIRYHTADPKRQVIGTVEYRNTRTGQTSVYSVPNAKETSDPVFVMQCADCHNRQGHAFEQPDEAVNHAMAEGQIPLGLPFAHKAGVEILKRSYNDQEEAAKAIPAAFSAFYAQKYPDVASKRSGDISQAGKVLANLYDQNVFPDLGVKWGTYPDNLGHADNFGCFRCHDESHQTAQKKTISQDCTICHNPLAVDESNPAVLKTLGIDMKLSQLFRP